MDRMTQLLTAQTCWNEADALAAVRSTALRSWPERGQNERRRAILTDTVEGSVIPELLTRHRAGLVQARAPGLVLDASHVAELLGLVLDQNDPAALAFVGSMHDRGAAPDAIYLDLLAPTARRLGELWQNDECDILSVSVGVWRLQAAMRTISGRTRAAASVLPGSNKPSPAMVMMERSARSRTATCPAAISGARKRDSRGAAACIGGGGAMAATACLALMPWSAWNVTLVLS